MSSAAWRALLATRSSASSAVIDSEYLPLFFHAPMPQRVDDGAAALLVEHACHVRGRAALRTVARHEEERVRHTFTQRLAFLGVGSAPTTARARE